MQGGWVFRQELELRGNLGDIDLLNKVTVKRAIGMVKKGPLYSVSQ